jgi:quercetin dioxygenase-like cupin family protein
MGGQEPFGPYAKVFQLAQGLQYQSASIVSKVILKSAHGTLTLFAFDAAQELSEHTAPFDAMVQVLEGEAQITIEGQPHKVKAGETIIMPANKPHALLALTPFKMLLTMLR